MSSHHPDAQEQHQSRHPTFKQYVMIATILFAITIVEFLIIVPDNLRGSSVTIAPLIMLSALKFAIVIMFYMHLKFDSKLFTGVFIGGLALGFAVVLAVLGLFGAFQPTPRGFAEENAVPFVHGAGPEEHGPGSPEAPQPPGGPEPGEPPGGPEPGGPPGGPPPGPGPLVAQGQALFTGKGGCLACHTVEGVASGMVGPDLTHIGTEAANRKPGMSARDYITESIKEPEAYVATGVERALPGLMTSALTSSLSDDEVEALVEFLLAQK